MPVYNGERFLRQAIESVLDETFADFELIISDNASTDGTRAICLEYIRRDPRVRYYRNERNLTAARNFNRVYELSSGEYFKWATADDLAAPGLLEKCIAVLDAHPEVVLYDSSRYPILQDRYGHAGTPRFPYEIRRNGHSALLEFPIGTRRMLGVNLPIGGGGYFRLIPWAFTRRAIRHVNVRERQPVMFYFHPWELDPGQPPPHALAPSLSSLCRAPQRGTKLSCLLRDFRFGPARTVLAID